MSSSLACYVAAPRMFQAFARDNLFPYVGWFGKGHGASNEPYRGYLATFLISLVFTLSGHLNVTFFQGISNLLHRPSSKLTIKLTLHAYTGYRTDHIDVQTCIVFLGQHHLLSRVLHKLTIV